MKTPKVIGKSRMRISQKRDTLLYAAEQIFNRHDPMFTTLKSIAI